jgi:hypothetical protein
VHDIVTYLACHDDRPVTADRLRQALSRTSPTTSDLEPAAISEGTLRSYITATRAAIGPHRLPDATGGTGHRLAGLDAAHAAGRLSSFYDHLTGHLDANHDIVAPTVTARHQQLRRQPPTPPSA